MVVALSQSGETSELMAAVRTLIQNGATIIAITGNRSSDLARSSTTTLNVPVEAEGEDSGAGAAGVNDDGVGRDGDSTSKHFPLLEWSCLTKGTYLRIGAKVPQYVSICFHIRTWPPHGILPSYGQASQ